MRRTHHHEHVVRRSVMNDPWGEMTRLSFDESCCTT